MALAQNDRLVTNTGNGSNKTFAYDFPIKQASELRVITVTNGVTSVKVLNTDYTVTIGSNGLGNVVFGTAPASGVSVRISGVTPAEQTATYTTADRFPAAAHEGSMDLLARVSQELQRDMQGTLRVEIGEPPLLPLPAGSVRNNKIHGYDNNGNPIFLSPIDGSANARTALGADRSRTFAEVAADVINVKDFNTSGGAVAAFLATTTGGNAIAPNANQRALFIPGGVTTLTDPIVMNGFGQSVVGEGGSSVLSGAGIVINGYRGGNVRNLSLNGASPFGLQIGLGETGSTRAVHIDNLLIQEKTIGLEYGNETNPGGAVWNLMSNITLRRNDIGARFYETNGLEITNFSVTESEQSAVIATGLGQLKIVNGNVRPAVAGGVGGPAFHIIGTDINPSLESYFINFNFNQGSPTIIVPAVITDSGIPVSFPGSSPPEGNQIRVVCEQTHNLATNFRSCWIGGSSVAEYNGEWSVGSVIDDFTMTLQVPYTANATANYLETWPGLFIDGQGEPSNQRANDIYFRGGSVNNLHVKNAYNILFDQRGVAKERAWLSGSVDRILFRGVFRGRDIPGREDVYPAGPASLAGWHMEGQFDDSPGNLVVGETDTSVAAGVRGPWAARGFKSGTKEPRGFVEMLVRNNEVSIGLAEIGEEAGLVKFRRPLVTGPVEAIFPGPLLGAAANLIKAIARVTVTAEGAELVHQWGITGISTRFDEYGSRTRLTFPALTDTNTKVLPFVMSLQSSRVASCPSARTFTNSVDVDLRVSGNASNSGFGSYVIFILALP